MLKPGAAAPGDAMPTLTLSAMAGMSIADALADIGIGRKAWRQLRAELQLEDDSLAALLVLWRRSETRVRSALRGLLPAEVAGVAAERLECAAEVQAAGEAAQHPSERRSVVGTAQSAAGAANAEPTVTHAVVAMPTLAAVRDRLPRLPPGVDVAAEGSEERRRALRRHLQLVLPQDSLTLLKALGTELCTRGPAYAGMYIEKAWQILVACGDDGIEILANIISTQADLDIQRALRCALQHRCETVDSKAARVPTKQVPRKASGADHFNICDIPEAQLTVVLSFCASATCLGSLGTASPALQRLAGSDFLWALVWQGECGKACLAEFPASDLRSRFLSHRASLCVECRAPTRFEHAIVGCRLCERCERGCSRYALIRSSTAMVEYQLPERCLLTLPHMDGATGRVYLRSAVDSVATRYHSKEGLQRLRAKHDVGMTASGRQRRRECPQGRASGQSQARELRARRGRVDEDPCCFEATALQLAAC